MSKHVAVPWLRYIVSHRLKIPSKCIKNVYVKGDEEVVKGLAAWIIFPYPHRDFIDYPRRIRDNVVGTLQKFVKDWCEIDVYVSYNPLYFDNVTISFKAPSGCTYTLVAHYSMSRIKESKEMYMRYNAMLNYLRCIILGECERKEEKERKTHVSIESLILDMLLEKLEEEIGYIKSELERIKALDGVINKVSITVDELSKKIDKIVEVVEKLDGLQKERCRISVRKLMKLRYPIVHVGELVGALRRLGCDIYL